MKAVYSKRFIASLFWISSITAFSQTKKQPEQIVSSVAGLIEALSKAVPGSAILLEDGTYPNMQLRITCSGTPGKPIRIAARNSGKVVISGDAKIELRGNYLIFDGFFFKDGNRNPEQWKTHGPGLVAIYGSYNRITNCAFDAFDEANSAWITTSLTANGNVPTHCRIDHCSFTNKLTFDQVINLNNAFAPVKDSSKVGPPMYHRVDHNFFSNPKKPGNAGGGIRIGYYRYDVGRCLVDSNLFLRQDSEPEIITSKSRENVYYANTFMNCRGTLNFRHGDKQVAVNNFFVGTDTAFEYGGMFVWGSGHVIGANYFELPTTMTDRGGAALYLNPGAKGTEHALAFNILVVNNAFVNTNGYAVNFNPLDKQRKKQCDENGWVFQTPHHIRFVSNLFYAQSDCRVPFFRYDYPGNHANTWQDNIAAGCQPGVSIDQGIKEVSCQLAKANNVYRPSSCTTFKYYSVEGIPSIEGIPLDFNRLINQGVRGRPLLPDDVGPVWKMSMPIYAQTGLLPTPLKTTFERVIKRQKEN